MDYDEALAFLDRHLDREKQVGVAGRVDGLSLEPMRRLLHLLGDPQAGAPAIHITGTNGKGSVARMVAELVAAHGLTVGLYTSPHLQRVNERLVVIGPDGAAEAIGDDAFAAVLGELADLAPLAGVQPSWFELLTAAAFAWFAQVPVDVAVVEVGMLGRFDATNVVDGQVAVITSIGEDHTDGAPGWQLRVADEKAGIVKPDSFLVLGETDLELRPIFEAAAGGADGDPRLWVRDEDFACLVDRPAVGGRLLDLRTPGGAYDDVFLPLHGAHQADNAAMAVAATEAFFARPLEPTLVEVALGRVRLPARIEVVSRQPLVVVDAAHNPDGAHRLAETLVDEFAVEGRTLLVVGLLAGRDPVATLEALDVASADLVVACTPDSPRALAAADLASVVSSFGVPVVAVPDVGAAVHHALDEAAPGDAVVVTGSFYVAGAARAALGCGAPDRSA